ncbi:hypothetical protein J3A84_05560 [Proteiniclasticum sp. SCR006]|uniref:Uncharacterized protein n=1 Tax=Proteiniclasticum aestuarii TaxID=2817862 RepID=A0A939HAK8_9CLOT|nr:hypothetical protein [Proteiniclasticum aestuarii]MBO1264506.1 hypothetical protein [Proteiniclasticum aestuarii]
MNNNLYRLGALMYTDDTSSFSRKTTIRKIIEAFFVLCNNESVVCSNLPEMIKDTFDIELHIDEIHKVIYSSKYFEYIGGHCSKHHFEHCNILVRLSEKRYSLIASQESLNSIYHYMNEYYNANEELKNLISIEGFTQMIEKFLYLVFVQNIEKSSRMFDVHLDKTELLDDLKITEIEKKIINEFLDYDDDNKNKAIYDIGSLALEYVILSGGIDLKSQEPNILKKTLYLDTNIIYRLLGINGEQRRIKVRNLIERCIETGQQIRISDASKKEFFDSIKHQLLKIEKLPSPIRYTEPIDNAIMRDFYDSNSGNTKFYLAKIQAEYEEMIREFKIHEDKKDLYDTVSGHERIQIKKYVESISRYKNKTEKEVKPDAINIFYIESMRKNQGQTFRELKEFFLTSDKNLINWEASEKDTYPVTIYPSNWLSIILRFGNRTSDDYKSFVSFIRNVQHEEKRDPDVVLATMQVIAQKAETAEKQKALFDIFVENEYENIANTITFEDKISYAEEKIPEYIDEIYEKQEERLRKLEEATSINKEEHQQEIEILRQEIEMSKSKEDKQRNVLVTERFNTEISDRRRNLAYNLVAVVVSGTIIWNTLPSILSLNSGEVNSEMKFLELVITVIFIPTLLRCLSNIFKLSSVKCLEEKLLLKEITREEIDKLLEHKKKMFIFILFS